MTIVNTDNFGRDCPNEKFLYLPIGEKEALQKICNIINKHEGSTSLRYYKVVENGYKLVPGFEP